MSEGVITALIAAVLVPVMQSIIESIKHKRDRREGKEDTREDDHKMVVEDHEQIAWEVWHGQWGSGDDRKAKLTAAGYDYSAIQELVNQGVGKTGEYPAGDTTDYKAKYETLLEQYNDLQKTNAENLQTATDLKKDYEARIAAAISALNGGSK